MENRLVTHSRKERVGQIEYHRNTYTTVCKTDSQRELDVWLRELCDNLEEWKVGGDFKKEGTYVSLWPIHVDVWQELTQYCKAITLQLKINCIKNDKLTLKKMNEWINYG